MGQKKDLVRLFCVPQRFSDSILFVKRYFPWGAILSFDPLMRRIYYIQQKIVETEPNIKETNNDNNFVNKSGIFCGVHAEYEAHCCMVTV